MTKLIYKVWKVVFRRRRIRIVRRKRKIGRGSTAASKKDFTENKHRAEVLVRERIEYFNNNSTNGYAKGHDGGYGFTYGKVTVRNQKSRWGSCSKKGNLNFNYRIALLPSHLADYVIVHELCHLGEFNHSRAFWNLVARAVPDYAKCRAELRKIRMT